jgi:hypothetical protein
MVRLMVISLLLIGCTSTDIPEGTYACLDLDGYFTDSQGRIIKVPDGVTLSQELIDGLCS